MTHRSIATRQSAAYQNNKSNLPSDTLLIEIDWKQKVIIGIYWKNYYKILIWFWLLVSNSWYSLNESVKKF